MKIYLILGQYFLVKPIVLVNKIFDANLFTFKKVYSQSVEQILPFEIGKTETIAIICFAIFITWGTIHMLSIYRRRIYKKVKQIITYEKAFPFLGNLFTVSKSVQYSKQELRNNYISITSLYRITVILVWVALFFLLIQELV